MKAAVLTISDRGWRGQCQDRSGPALVDLLRRKGWEIVATRLLPDEAGAIREAVVELAQQDCQLIVTTGGTGIAVRDVTPEAVRPLLDKEIPGLGELMRLRGLEKTPYAALSRSVAGLHRSRLIICLPGSPKGARDSLAAVIDIVPHALEVAAGEKVHPLASPEKRPKS